MSGVFGFIHCTNNPNVIDLQSELKINNAYYPNVEMV